MCNNVTVSPATILSVTSPSFPVTQNVNANRRFFKYN